MEGGDIAKMKGLAVTLLALMIVVGAVFLIGAAWKEQICTNDASTHVYSGGTCQVSSTNSTAVSLDALTYVGTVEAALVVAIGFLGIIVLVGIAKILVRMTKGF